MAEKEDSEDVDTNTAIEMAKKAIHKVKPSLGDAKMSESHRKDYDRWMKVIRKLDQLKEKK